MKEMALGSDSVDSLLGVLTSQLEVSLNGIFPSKS